MKYTLENIYEIGKLQDVLKISLQRKAIWQDYLGNKNLEGFILIFEKRTLLLWAVGHDDTIKLELRSIIKKYKGYKTQSVKEMNPWEKTIGKNIFYLWTMTNQKGYMDGLQIEFHSDRKTQKILVQLIVCASKFKIYSVKSSKINSTP